MMILLGILVAAAIGFITLVLLGILTRPPNTQTQEDPHTHNMTNKQRKWAQYLEKHKQFYNSDQDDKDEEEKEKEKEYSKWKSAIQVQDQGVVDDELMVDLDLAVLSAITLHKLTKIEILADQIGISVVKCAQIIQSLIEQQRVCGVIEDRGTFIRIEDHELQALAQYVEEKGKFTLAEFTAQVNRTIKV
jgi:hypothetical protein